MALGALGLRVSTKNTKEYEMVSLEAPGPAPVPFCLYLSAGVAAVLATGRIESSAVKVVALAVSRGFIARARRSSV